MKTVHCFLALNLDLKTVRSLTGIQSDIIKATTQEDINIKWVPPQNIHVTVRFLGAITEPMIQAIKDNLEPILRTTSPIKASSTGISYFLNEKTKSGIIYSGIEPQNELDQFHSIVSKQLVNAGFKEKNEKYIPHATIGRVKNTNFATLKSIIDQFENINAGESLFKNIICFRSKFSSKDTNYKLIWRLPLTGTSRPANKKYYKQCETPQNNDIKLIQNNISQPKITENKDETIN